LQKLFCSDGRNCRNGFLSKKNDSVSQIRFKIVLLQKIRKMASLNKQALLRYKIIDKLIRQKNYPTMQDIIELCEEQIGKRFSKETIQKDIEAMKNDLSLGYEAPIRYNRLYKGYEYTDEDFSINTTNLNDIEKEQLKSASEILLQFKESKLGESIKLCDLSQKLKILVNSPELLYQNKIIDFENSNFSKYEELQKLYQAMKNKNTVNLVYYCHQENDIRAYTVFPLLLKEYRNNWYLFVENKFNKPQALNLNYIFDVLELDTKASPSDAVDYNSYLQHSIGVQINSDYLEELEILFKANVANDIKSNPLHDSQQILEEHENGDLLIRYNVYITDELISEILRFGSNAFVVKNDLVQELIFDEIFASFEEYRRVIKH